MGGELSWGSGVAVYVGVGAHKFVVGNRNVHLLSYNKEMCIVAVLYLIYEICDIMSQFQHYLPLRDFLSSVDSMSQKTAVICLIATYLYKLSGQ